MDALSQLVLLAEVAGAATLGGFIGLEREVAGKEAGLRTQMIVAGAAALLVSVAGLLVDSFAESAIASMIQADPIRVIEAIITGVSFLGAGTIIRDPDKRGVEGLTTAASLLLSAAVGVSVGVGVWVLAIGVTVLTLVLLRTLNVIAHKLHGANGDEASAESDG